MNCILCYDWSKDKTKPTIMCIDCTRKNEFIYAKHYKKIIERII